MKIALSDIGEKLSTFRKTLGLSQKEVAEAMGVYQSQVSKIESGEGGSIETLLEILNYYGTTYQVNFIFAAEFDVVKHAPGETLTSPYNSIAVEKLSLLGEEFNARLTEVKKLLSIASS
jgi:transcriptional regulator with XRE-family HTH domain